jgi:HD-GYP domain-containing protein (c-di-GMP phosphodiesterase class II)
MILGFYTLPTLFSAYSYGRKHAILTALASILIVVLVNVYNPPLFSLPLSQLARKADWYEITAWAGLLIITAAAMGTLYERKEAHFHELRRTYFGVLAVLQQIISNDKYTHNHSFRVAYYSCAISVHLGLAQSRIDDIRAAALLHDIGKLESSRELLHKAASLSPQETEEMHRQLQTGMSMLEPVGGSLRRIVPIILAHHERNDETGSRKDKPPEIPLEARVLAVADAYDNLTSDRPYRRAVNPFEAKELIVRSTGNNFGADVIRAFESAFNARDLELPEGVLAQA